MFEYLLLDYNQSSADIDGVSHFQSYLKLAFTHPQSKRTLHCRPDLLVPPAPRLFFS
jgi:hypothetical protein